MKRLSDARLSAMWLVLGLAVTGCAERHMTVRWFGHDREAIVEEARAAEEAIERVGGPFVSAFSDEVAVTDSARCSMLAYDARPSPLVPNCGSLEWILGTDLVASNTTAP